MAEESAWGVVPPVIAELVQVLSRKIDHVNTHLGSLVWPDKPRDVEDLLRLSVGDAHKIARAGTDLRALLTAYSHQFHEPRPVMAAIAKAQDATRQGVPRRYGQATVDAIRELMSPQPNIALVLDAFPSLSLDDLTTLSGPVGRAASDHRDRTTPLVRMREQRRAASEKARKTALQEIGEALPRRTKPRTDDL